MKNKIIQRIISYYKRYKKQRFETWRFRLEKAFEHFWRLFGRMPISKTTLLWAERNHKRILSVKIPRRLF